MPDVGIENQAQEHPGTMEREPWPCTATLSLLQGTALTITSTNYPTPVPDSCTQVRLELQPDQPTIVGRCPDPNYEVPYLEVGYHSFDLMPGTCESVLQYTERDLIVSRAHFMLKQLGAGVLFTNGVPRRGGGIRPPLNGTRLLTPEDRLIEPAEELFIPRGEEITIRLPNDTILEIAARD